MSLLILYLLVDQRLSPYSEPFSISSRPIKALDNDWPWNWRCSIYRISRAKVVNYYIIFSSRSSHPKLFQQADTCSKTTNQTLIFIENQLTIFFLYCNLNIFINFCNCRIPNQQLYLCKI